MEWVERLNQSVHYIEGHLTEEIDYGQLGKIACCSAYHYQRMFAYMAGVTLSEYIRRRKMSLAAVDLQNGGKVIDVAEKYGYHSPTAFNRAFQSVHGIAPSLVKGEGVSVKSFPPIAFQIAVKGAEAMNYRIETKEAFRIVGICAPLEKELEKNFMAVPKLWEQAAMDGTLQRLAEMMDGTAQRLADGMDDTAQRPADGMEQKLPDGAVQKQVRVADAAPVGLLGVSACGDEEQWRYFIAVASSAECGAFEEYTVPAATWAIFPGTGVSQSIQELEQRIVTEWLPNSGYEYGNAPDIEVYLNPDPSNAQYEVWIPVRKVRE